jgi:iron(III) transport system substrate-binding protein
MRKYVLGCVAAALIAAACQPAPPATPVGTGGGAGGQAAPASGSAASAPHSAEVQRLLGAARDSGETALNVQWGDTYGGAQGARRFEALFNRMYGTDIRVNYTPGPSMTDMAGRLAQEVAAGHRASSDLMAGTEGTFATLLNREVLEEYDYTQLAPRITGDVVAFRGVGVEVGGIVGGIAYNSDLVARADAPRKLEDALDPKWKGKIASTQNAALLDRVAARPEWGPDRMKAYVARLSQNLGGLIRCGEGGERLSSGEFQVMVLHCGSYQIRRDTAKGAPLGFVIPDDGATIGYFHLGVPRNSAHPNLGKLFINMVLSEEGQRTLYELEFVDNPALPGSQSAVELADLKARGIEPLKMDVKRIAEHPELREIARDLERILREGQ